MAKAGMVAGDSSKNRSRPNSVSKAKGNRNFIEAVNHSQKRRDAA